jgi:hypothetical protein
MRRAHAPAILGGMSLLDNLSQLVPGRPSRATSPLEAALGAEHPLCQSQRELGSAVLQLGETTVFVAAVAAFARFHAAGAVLFVGVASLAAVSVRVITAYIRRDLRAMEAIASGLEAVPSAHVRGVRARLLRPQERERIASALASYVTPARASRPAETTGYVAPPCAADGAQDELRAVITLLRGDPPSEARGLALCSQLLSDYPSPLCGQDSTTLRAQLGRIRFLLSR